MYGKEKRVCVEINNDQIIINCHNEKGWILISKIELTVSKTRTITGVYNIIDYLEIFKHFDTDTTLMILQYL
jgi:hypothetical protein